MFKNHLKSNLGSGYLQRLEVHSDRVSEGNGPGSCVLSCSVVPDSLRHHRLYVAHRLLCAWDSPGTNPGVGCHFLLQGIVPTQGLSLGLLHCRQILYCLSHQGSPVQGPNTVRSPTNESKALPVLSHANTEQGYPVQSKAMPTL